MAEYSPRDGAFHGQLCRETKGKWQQPFLPSLPPIALAAAATPSRKAPGTLQRFVFHHGLELVERLCFPLGRRWKEAGWSDLDSVPSNFSWVLVAGWGDCTEEGCSTSLDAMP